jgi:UDP-glucose 4-epimerase
MAGEHYLRVYWELFGLETVSLRYFNVYGPRQDPDSAYAAVIPKFIAALRAGEPPVIHGDGGQSRDFAFIDDVVAANLAAATAPTDRCAGKAYNVPAARAPCWRCSDPGRHPRRRGRSPRRTRPGDVRHSFADTCRPRRPRLVPALDFAEVRRTVDWFQRRTS